LRWQPIWEEKEGEVDCATASAPTVYFHVCLLPTDVIAFVFFSIDGTGCTRRHEEFISYGGLHVRRRQPWFNA
jgi:hypothetical protein